MTPPPLASFVPDGTGEGLAPEVHTFMRFLATARALTPAQVTLLTQYESLSPERRTLVDELIRELSKLPPPPTDPST